MSARRFRIAFSFAGETREFVAQVAELLARCFGPEAILYDKFHESEFARPDLSLYLPDLYRDEADLIVPVFCARYDEKEWPGLEWLAIHARIQKRRYEEVLLSRFDNVLVKGLMDGAGFIELDDKKPHQFASTILERLAHNEGLPKGHYTTLHAQHLAPPPLAGSEKELRIRDFLEIVGKVLSEFKTSFVEATAEFPLLVKTWSQHAPWTKEKLEAIGHELWTLVGEKSTRAGGRNNFDDFWKKLLADLRLRFPRANTSAVWKKIHEDPKHYQFKEDEWKEFLKRLMDDPIFDPLAPEVNAALRPYRDHLVVKFSEINLSGIGGPAAQSESEGKAELSSIYINLDTKTSIDAKTKTAPTEQGNNGYIEQHPSGSSPLSALQQMAVHTHLVLIGLPGSGKSTLLEFFSLCLAKCGIKPESQWLKRLSTWPKEEMDLVPVFVELRHFAASLPEALPAVDGGEQLKQYIVAQLKTNARLHKCEGALTTALEQGRAIVFLDGLDEVPNNDKLRRFVLKTVEAFALGPFGNSRIVVTCRPRSYEETAWQLQGFEKAELAALTQDKTALFIERFYNEVARRNPEMKDDIEDRKRTLGQALRTSELRELATNPFMLTVMAWLHRFAVLPRKRAMILDKIVDQLLYKWEERERGVGPHLGKPALTETLTTLIQPHGVDIGSIRRVLCRLAYRARAAGEPRLINQSPIHAVRIYEEDLRSALEELLPPDSMTEGNRKLWAMQVSQFIDKRTGLLVSEGKDPEGKYSFTMPYKLEEFLAGEHLTNSDELEDVGSALKMKGPRYNFEEVVAQLIGENGYWEEVVKWAGAVQAHVKNSKNLARDLALELCSSKTLSFSDSTRLRRAVIAGEILLEVGLAEVINSHKVYGPDCLKKVRKKLDDFMRHEKLSPKQRAAAGAARGWLEDLPVGVGLVSNKKSPELEKLPELVWIKIPAGSFRMGDKVPGTNVKTQPLTKITTPYSISRYPVTVVQFQAFVDDGGYKREEWWNWSPNADQWLKKMKETLKGKKPGPENYDHVFQTPNHPQVGVSWYEAMAYCKWLNEKLKLEADSIRLPTEREWVRVVRGPEGQKGRDFPSESSSAHTDLNQQCNVDQSRIGHTSAVDLFPDGDTPQENNNDQGVADLAGNVWEWCLSSWQENPSQNGDPDISEEIQGERPHVARGGSWDCGHDTRFIDPLRRGFRPEVRSNEIGFRLVKIEKP